MPMVRSFGQLKLRTRGRSLLLEPLHLLAASLPHPEGFAGGDDHAGMIEKPGESETAEVSSKEANWRPARSLLGAPRLSVRT